MILCDLSTTPSRHVTLQFCHRGNYKGFANLNRVRLGPVDRGVITWTLVDA